MFILFFICWIVFNQAFTLEIAIFGLVLSALMLLFICKFMDYSIKKDIVLLKKFPSMIVYALVLLKEIIKANFVLYKLFFLHSKEKREPVMVTFESRLKTRTARVFLANAITLTPGTISVKVKGNKLTVHCYDKSLAAGLNDTVFEKRLLKLEEGWD
ncbi:MAG: Na+/H+ antiporter subunit E [Lachnospiraceae bacterium]|nr:Na+/H+ antiporter subunit E [Lachnospiraceae bacterium]